MRADEDALRGLMVDGLSGDAAAHAALLRLLVPVLRGFYRRRANGSADDIEDLVQETLIAVHSRRATYDRERVFTAWLFAIARYKMVDHFRRVRRLQPIEGLEDLLLAEDFEPATQARLDVEELLAVLPPKQARMIRATRLDGLSVAEAAKVDGIGESDVKVSVHRGLKALVARIQEGRDEHR
ncbi:sigma-70 family RNA polymerase sigma factor [Sphingomonas psychrotolerans]|uniref:Sigma-70 family RNA polymerase sigma factor n=1 Tax=Sphingomonas psychrotolerans TaxID=1327635 RepID=A0ABU3N8U6_9SPHN|nr:sigma-70 family RNA polymerase sigma factor [Sphingomonas psychrotolerans]MDT8760933.1 sigma-70 family RNA polymerase sigma factor [Sphingomonas psychrotolerans]